MTGEHTALAWSGVRLTIDADHDPLCCSDVLDSAIMNVVADIATLPQAVNEDWYKDAIIYQLHVKAFADSDDGVGDFGQRQHLGYLQDLGVNAIWLFRFTPAPAGRRIRYRRLSRINPAFGTMADFNPLHVQAKKRGLKSNT